MIIDYCLAIPFFIFALIFSLFSGLCFYCLIERKEPIQLIGGLMFLALAIALTGGGIMVLEMI